MSRFYEIRDPIYGTIQVNELERKIIDSKPFQRLRRIKQLSLTNFVYPGANHTRFEHSIGVMHLATLMFDSITQDENNICMLRESEHIDSVEDLKKYRQVVRLAALLHDIGHGPFSHSAEELFPRRNNEGRYKHEDYSIGIIKNFFEGLLDKTDLNEYGITVEEISSLLQKDDITGFQKGEYFWKLLISSQLDADRGDYLLRDSYYTGVKYGIYDHHRIIESMTLADGIEGSTDLIIAIKEGGWHAAESLLLSRYLMYTQVYFHKTRLAYNYHIKEALGYILKNETTSDTFPKPESLESLEKFLKWDDYYAWIMFEKYKDSCIHCGAILKRNHFRSVYHTSETPNSSELDIVNEIKMRLGDKGIKCGGIECFEYSTQREWYNIERGEEIYVLPENRKNVVPLSKYSSLVYGSLELPFHKIEIYVIPNKVEEAKRIVNETLKDIKPKP